MSSGGSVFQATSWQTPTQDNTRSSEYGCSSAPKPAVGNGNVQYCGNGRPVYPHSTMTRRNDSAPCNGNAVMREPRQSGKQQREQAHTDAARMFTGVNGVGTALVAAMDLASSMDLRCALEIFTKSRTGRNCASTRMEAACESGFQ